MQLVNNINADGKIEKMDSPALLNRTELKTIIFEALNSNEYSFSWNESSALATASLPYEGLFFDGKAEIKLNIYVWNITKTCIIHNFENDKRIQIQSSVNNSGLVKPVTDKEKTLLLGVYNCPNNPIIAAWDGYYYKDHKSISCYVDVRELKKALDNNVSKSNRGSDVYAMTKEYLPVYTSHLQSDNKTDLETSEGKLQTAEFKKERNSKKQRSIAQIENLHKKINALSEVEKETLIKQRIGQGFFRDLLIQKYGCKCALCNISTVTMLRASHIKAWKASSQNQKLDENNGLLLCAHHDALFDKFLISFNDDGSPIISKTLSEEERVSLGLLEINKIVTTKEMHPFLRWHRTELAKKEQNAKNSETAKVN